jgi:hypothetical protein
MYVFTSPGSSETFFRLSSLLEFYNETVGDAAALQCNITTRTHKVWSG